LLAGLAAQSLTLGSGPAVLAIAGSAVVFLLLLLSASVAVPLLTAEMRGPLRMVGPAVRRWGGYVMMVVGLWFLVLAFLTRPPLLP
jgi:protein-S-isoprenylcysteine O-methyltransferase Ste14